MRDLAFSLCLAGIIINVAFGIKQMPGVMAFFTRLLHLLG